MATQGSSRKAAAGESTTKSTPKAKTGTKTKAPARSAAPTAGKRSVAKAATKKAATKSATKPAKKAAKTTAKSSADNYTKPDLREKIKADVVAGEKGGRPGQWSARKAQLVAHEYEAEGGGYKHPRNEAQKSLQHWGDEHWHTADGKPAIQGKETHRYLPDAAWKELSPEQQRATDEKKVAGSKHGRQFVPNTKPASKARKHATSHKD